MNYRHITSRTKSLSEWIDGNNIWVEGRKGGDSGVRRGNGGLHSAANHAQEPNNNEHASEQSMNMRKSGERQKNCSRGSV